MTRPPGSGLQPLERLILWAEDDDLSHCHWGSHWNKPLLIYILTLWVIGCNVARECGFCMRLPRCLPLQVSYNAILELAWSGFHMLDTKDPIWQPLGYWSEMLQINLVWPGVSVAPALLWGNWRGKEEETLRFLPLCFPSWFWLQPDR